MAEVTLQPRLEMGTPRPAPVEIDGRRFQPLAVPSFYISQIQTMAMANDLSLILARARPAMPIDTSVSTEGITLAETACIVQMSYQTVKDLHFLLGGAIAEFEKQWGPIQTEFLQRDRPK